MTEVAAKVGLSDAQTSELLRLQDRYQFSLPRNLSDPTTCLGHNLNG
ncbi:MAG: hypothetical protein JWR69_1017, partial [Pedosphaera sp.]|nr:hypothetical protein [Pedosphaera sp.]